MSLRINTNVAALNAYNNLNSNQSKLEDAFQKLSSGLRINKAADDASGLSIAQGLSSQINGLTQAVSNANDAT
ncbi:MAG TPA: flagellin, partial [Jatrophihabitantaceae bacterium]|nr:flagellin [Jatrophihabitantaceae bacterium]